MKKVMKSATLLASVGAMLCFAGCNSVGDKPEDVVLAVLKAAQSGKGDQEFYNKYCEGDTAALFTMFGAKLTEALTGATFTVAYSFIDDDVAVVKIKQDGGEKSGNTHYYDVKKIDGQWKLRLNKEAHGDYWCISQETITECVEAFKIAFLKGGTENHKERCTQEVLDEAREMVSKAPPDEMKKAINGLKVKAHEKSFLHDDEIEIEIETPTGENGKMQSGKLILKVVDGKWKVHAIH